MFPYRRWTNWGLEMCSDFPMITWEIQSQSDGSLFAGSCCDWSAKGWWTSEPLNHSCSSRVSSSLLVGWGMGGAGRRQRNPVLPPHIQLHSPKAASQISTGISQVSLLNLHCAPQGKGLLEGHSDILDLEAKKHQPPGKGPGTHPSEKHLFSLGSFAREEERDVDSNGNRYEIDCWRLQILNDWQA